MTNTNTASGAAILFEHEDGRYAVNPDTTGDPAWHRLGPVDISALAAPAHPGLTDAYVGAREDLTIWTRRALEAERDLRSEKESASRLVGELNAVNGPAHMGEAHQPATAYAALPEPYDDGEESDGQPTYSTSQVLSFADATHALRVASRGQAPAGAADGWIDDAGRIKWLEWRIRDLEGQRDAALSKAATAQSAPVAQQPSPTPQADSQPAPVVGRMSPSKEWLETRLAIADDSGVQAGVPPKNARPCDAPPGCNSHNCLECNDYPHAARAPADSMTAPAWARQEKALEDTLRERDEADEFIDTLLDEVLGADRAEWSSVYGRSEALEEVRERITALHKPAVDRAWAQFQVATQQAGTGVTVSVGSQEFDLAETDARFTTADMATACGQAFREGRAAPTPPAQAADSVLEDAAPDIDASFEDVRRTLCKLPRYSFALDSRGNIRRCEDKSGNWIEFDAAHALFDPVAVDAARKHETAAMAAKKGYTHE